MDDLEFDKTLIRAACLIAAERCWGAVSVYGAAQTAGLPLPRARQRFPSRASILLRLGSIADQSVLEQPADDASIRERLFDLLMRRFDALLPYRAGIAALMRALPADPATALLLAVTTRRSMGWMLEAAGVPVAGLMGHLKRDGLIAVWGYATKSFLTDESPDLSATMAALDKALNRAASTIALLERGPTSPQ